MSTVAPDSFLTLHYRLLGPDGAAVVDTFAAKPATLQMGSGQLSPALERHLMGLQEGQQARFQLAPGEAFGARSPELVQRVALALLHRWGDPDEQYAVGDVVQFPTPDGQGRYAGVLREWGPPGAATPEWAVFDFNHPLAGQAVSFEVRVIGILQGA